MRPILPLALIALAAPFPALAGGIGVVGTAGFHGDRVYAYSVDEIEQAEQLAPQDQLNPNYGLGLEVVLGDKDLKVAGIFRGFYLQDAALQAPTNAGVDGELVYNVRDTPKDLGVVTAGLQWGVLGDPGALQMTVVGTIGAAVFTEAMDGYVTAEAGVGGTWMAARRTQVVASVTGGARYWKRFYPTTNAYAGVRYLFD